MLMHRIFGKIFVWIMLSSLAVGMIFIFVTLQDRLRLAEEAVIRENKLLAGVASNMIVAGYLNAQWPFQTLKLISDSENIVFLWVVEPDGQIHYADDPAMFGKFIEQPYFPPPTKVVVRDALSEQGEAVKLIIHPLEMEIGGEPWGLYLGASLKPMEVVKRKTISISVFAVISIFFVTGFFSFYFSRRITRPLDELRKGAGIIGKGNFAHRIKIKTGDEIEELAQSFNQMAKSLGQSSIVLEEERAGLEIRVRARTRELEEFTDSLEDKIKQRTRELQDRVNELENFHRLTVGRELKMIELKKALQEAESELKRLKGRIEEPKTKNQK